MWGRQACSYPNRPGERPVLWSQVGRDTEPSGVSEANLTGRGEESDTVGKGEGAPRYVLGVWLAQEDGEGGSH